MKNTLLYKKNKIWGFSLIIFTFFMIFAIIAKLPFSHALEDTQSEERKLVDIFPNIYATLMDQNGKIVSTTNPNKEVDNSYKSTSSTRYLSLIDNYYLYLETEELTNEDLDEKIDTNRYYYLNLPEELIPDSNNVITNPGDELELFNLGNLKGYGGIYYTDNIYQLKIRFDDIDNSFSAKLSYQYSLKITDKIYEQDEEQKIVNIEDLGSLIFYVKNKETPKVSNYTLKQSTTKKGLSEDIYTLTTTLTDIRDEENRIINGKLTISLDNDFGFNSSSYNKDGAFLRTIKVYVDGEELELRTSTSIFQWYYSDRIMINATATSFVDIDSGCTNNNYSCLINKIEFEITGGTTDNAIGVREIKIVFNEKLITTKYRDHTNSAIFEDNLENFTINTNYITRDKFLDPVITTYYDNYSYDVDSSVPTSFVHNIDISSIPSNYLELSINNSISKDPYDSFKYFLDASCFFSQNPNNNNICDGKLNVFIDGNLVSFNNQYVFSRFFTYNDFNTASDLALYMQMKEILGNDIENFSTGVAIEYPYYLWKSENLNSDGENYYMVFSYDTYNNAFTNFSKSGRNEYAYIPDENGVINGIPSLKLYLFNISNHNVKLTFEYSLENVVRDDDSSNKIGYFSTNTDVKYDYNYSESSNYSSPFVSNRYMTTTGEMINMSIIKWETIIDLEEINYFGRGYSQVFNITPINSKPFTLVSKLYFVHDNYIKHNAFSTNMKYGKDFLSVDYTLYAGKYNDETKKCDGEYKPIAAPRYGSSSTTKLEYQLNISDEYVVNNKICFVYFTEMDIPNSEYYGMKSELIINGPSRFNDRSSPAKNIIYDSNGYVKNFDSNEKSLKETIINETTTSNIWNYNIKIDSPTIPEICYSKDSTLPYACANTESQYNGNFQFYDQMEGSLAKYTTLDNIKVSIYTKESLTNFINFSRQDLSELDNEKCVEDTCVHISYPALQCINVPRNHENLQACLSYHYGEDYLSKLTKMDNGFSVIITGLNDTDMVDVTYETITDDVAALNDINNYNSNIVTYNNIYQNAWHYMEPYDASDFKIKKAENIFTRKYAAGVAVEKKNTTPNNCIETNSNQNCDGVKTYLTADTNKFKVNALVGQSSVSYVDINDKLISFMGNDSLTAEDINTFMKYLKVDNLKIIYKLNSAADSSETIVIYQNGAFADEWSNSTISYENIGNNFYSIHLVNNDNVIPAQSVFEIEYDLVFDIDNYRDIEGLDSYRNNNLYNGEMVSIKTDVEAIIPYNSSFASIEDAIASNNKNYIDSEKTTVHCFLDDYVNGDYLRPRKVKKNYLTFSVSNDAIKFDYSINAKLKSVGKSLKPEFNYFDFLSFDLSDIEEDKREPFMKLLVKYMTVSNIKIVESSTIYENNNVIPFSEERIEFSSSVVEEKNINGTFNLNKNDTELILSINGESEYDAEFTFYYTVNFNYNAFVEEAIRKNLLDSNLRIIGTDSIFEYKIVNTVYNYLLKLLDSASSGKISFSNLTPTIEKSVTYPSTDEQRWTLRTNSNQKIHIVDNLTINGDESIVNNISIGKMVIKIDDNIIYENGEFKDSYGDNVKVNINGNKLEFDFEDEALSENTSSIEIQYSTLFNREGYYESSKKKSGSYSLSNSATIERNGIESSTTKDSRTINFNYPFAMNKSFLGNGVNLATSNWRIEVFAKDLQKEDIVIKDTVNLTSDIGSYLSISNMIIKKVNGDEEKIVYDYNNKINNLSDRITIKDKDLGELEFNKNGEYEFIINVDKLEKEEKLIVDYELKVDEDKYKEDEKETGVEINIPNKVVVSSGEEEYTKSVTGKTTVESTLTKKFRIISRNTNTASIEWNININLDVDYEGKISDSSKVKIIDELFDSLEYIDGSLKVYSRISTGNSNENKLLKVNEDYEFVYEDHTIKIKLLNPSKTKVILIAFNTTCSSTEGLKNYVELEVDDEKIHESTDFIPPIFLRFIGGTIISKQSTAYSFTAKKYLNNELSSRLFKFNLKEVNILGQTIGNGVDITVSNDENGDISFGSIKYYKEGIHFYRIKEIKEDDENITYDSNEYTIMVKVGEYNNSYLIEKAVILSNNVDNDEIIFNNFGGETAVELSKNWDDNNNHDGKRKNVNGKVQLYKSIDGSKPIKVVGDEYLVDVPTVDGVIVKWDHLPVYENDKIITYSVMEEVDESVGYVVDNGENVKAENGVTKKITIKNTYTSNADVDPSKPSDPIEPEEQTPIEPNKPQNEDIPDNLKTVDNIIYSFIVFFISIGILICLFVYLSKYKKKSI